MSAFSSTGSTDSQDSAIEPSQSSALSSILVVCDDRWQVYHRLQELEIDCCCSGFQPLQVDIQTPTEALQLWSVVRRVSDPRSALTASLNRCWRKSQRRSD